MKVVTVLTDVDHEDFNLFLKPSCHFHTLDLTVLEAVGGYTSHRIKDRMLRAYLNKISGDEIIFFSDAYDAFFLSNDEEAIRKFLRFRAPLVFSSEINCWPSPETQKKYPPPLHHFNYLNCGAFIGYAWFLKKLYKKYPVDSFAGDQYEWSNQYYWHNVYLQNQDSIRIDYNCELFYNVSMPQERSALVIDEDETDRYLLSKQVNHLANEISFFGTRIRYNRKGTLPVHIHFPGSSSKSIMKGEHFRAVKSWM